MEAARVDIFKKVNQRVRDIKISFNPLFIWIILSWLLSKAIQLILRSDKTIWESFWIRLIGLIGN